MNTTSSILIPNNMHLRSLSINYKNLLDFEHESSNVWKHKSLFRPLIQITAWLILH